LEEGVADFATGIELFLEAGFCCAVCPARSVRKPSRTTKTTATDFRILHLAESFPKLMLKP
jgi:hypothetical protein